MFCRPLIGPPATAAAAANNHVVTAIPVPATTLVTVENCNAVSEDNILDRNAAAGAGGSLKNHNSLKKNPNRLVFKLHKEGMQKINLNVKVAPSSLKIVEIVLWWSFQFLSLFAHFSKILFQFLGFYYNIFSPRTVTLMLTFARLVH